MAETAEATVVFGVLNETSEHESRVALTPDIVTRLRKSGVNCLIESGAGVASHYVDEDYSKAGAQVVSADEVIARADVLGFVDRPSSALLGRVKQGTWIIGMLGSFTDADYVTAIEKAGLVGVAMEKLPRQLSSAQSMDEMTSQNSVMGYKAAIVAANAYGSFLPMMTTAAGTIRPAKVLILGAGIAGLQPSAPPSVLARLSPRTMCVRLPRAKLNPWARSSWIWVLTSPRVRARAAMPVR